VTADHEWHGRWVAALLALSVQVGRCINRTVGWLSREVSSVGGRLRELGRVELEERFDSHARHLAMELSFGACRCGHGRRVGSGGVCGRPDHQLASWRPEDCHLHAFVAAAVRGCPGWPPRVGAFAVSMLAEPLREEQVVRVDIAEFHVCHVCNADLLRTVASVGGLDLGSVTSGLHDLNWCPQCGTLADSVHTYQVARKNWLIVPAEWGGQYEAVSRHRCGCCGNLFAASDDRCPLCRQAVPPRHRLTSVWVRRVGLDGRRSSTRSEARGS